MNPLRLSNYSGARILPWKHLLKQYLDNGRDQLAGPWVRSICVAQKTVTELIDALGLCYVDCHGVTQFGPETRQLGLIVFPLTPQVRTNSAVMQTISMGGGLPNPPVSSRWRGTGFVSGAEMGVEFRVSPLAMPEESQIWHMSWEGKVAVMARFVRGRWETEK